MARLSATNMKEPAAVPLPVSPVEDDPATTARPSASSSGVDINGHIKDPATVPLPVSPVDVQPSTRARVSATIDGKIKEPATIPLPASPVDVQSPTRARSVGIDGQIKEPATIPLPMSPVDDDTEIPTNPTTPTTPKASDDDEEEDPTSDSYPVADDPTLLPGGSRDLSSIGVQAFFLGFMFATSVLAVWFFATRRDQQWRLPAFFVCLTLFHFLEFWTTAKYNTPACRASSFLLFNNGRAYTLANFFAMGEIVTSWWFPRYQMYGVNIITVLAGLAMVIVGQVVRSVAMIQASTSFNHIVQHERKDTHTLVTHGMYSYFRHPSYFGFFWWSIGTQLLVGNKICLVGFAFVLWRFFSHRIVIEEKHLVEFFGNDYKEFRKRTGTMIPFIA